MPTKTSTTKRLESMLTRAEAAIKRSAWFEAERITLKAIEAAREVDEFELMSRICVPLKEARRQRMLQAMEISTKVQILEHVEPEPTADPGIFMIRPPGVAADARRLRIAALHEETPLIIVTREPTTRLGLAPIAAVGRITVRVRIEEPKNPEKPSVSWVMGALEQLGDGAIDSLDPDADPANKVDSLLAFLDSVPDHQRLHDVLAENCKLAAG